MISHPVDQVLPWKRAIPVALQHVMVMYAGAIAVPLILGAAFHMGADQVGFLVNADLFCCGVATLIQCIGFWKFGIKLPVVMGVSFAAVGPLLAMARNGQTIVDVYGAVIAAGVFGLLIAPVFGRLVRFFPAVVTGSVISVIGITLLQVGIRWAGGGVGAKNFGDPQNLMIVAVVLLVILLINKYAHGFLSHVSVLLGMLVGYLLAAGLGMVSFDEFHHAEWFAWILPLRFGVPRFEFGPMLSLCLVMSVILVESTGMFLAMGEMVERPVDGPTLVRGLRTDALGTILGGLFNTFTYSSFSQNVGLVGMTGVHSRWAVAGAGGFLLLFGFLPKFGALVASIPQVVLGGAGLCMFGMVSATGIKILQRVDLERPANGLIIALSLAAGMIPMVAPEFFQVLPSWSQPLTHSGITLTAIVAVSLNAFLNNTDPASAPITLE